MAKVVDTEQMQKALVRAARNATHGSDEVRAGQYVSGDANPGHPMRGRAAKSEVPSQPRTAEIETQINEGREIAERLRKEARGAQQAWALWEALNGDSKDDRRELREALGYLGLSRQSTFLQGVLVRDTLLALFRMTDQAEDGFSLCAISRLLCNEELRAELSDRNWLLRNGYPDFLVNFEVSEQPKRIQFIRAFVSPRWSDQRPTDLALNDLRAKLKDVRDKVLAHPLYSKGVVKPSVANIREFLELTTALVEKSELVFLGSAQATKDHYEVCFKEADKLWDYFEEGPIRAHSRDIELQRKVAPE